MDAPSGPDIVRRDVDFALDDAAVPIDWCGDDVYHTTLLEALSLVFPEGERFFVDAVKRYRDVLTDGELRERVAGFIGQEAMHGREHRALNEIIAARWRVTPRLDRHVRTVLGRVRRILPASSQLAVTAALEHFTALMAEALLRQPRMRDEIHPSVRNLWLWHALEESEHKAVAFDVWRARGGGYIHRVAIMIATTAVFFAVISSFQFALLRERGALRRPWTLARGFVASWVHPGYLGRLLPAYLHYFWPGFHPDDRDMRATLDEWRTRLFGDRGELATCVRAA